MDGALCVVCGAGGGVDVKSRRNKYLRAIAYFLPDTNEISHKKHDCFLA